MDWLQKNIWHDTLNLDFEGLASNITGFIENAMEEWNGDAMVTRH